MLERSSGDGSGRGGRGYYIKSGGDSRTRGEYRTVSSGTGRKRLPSSARRHHSDTRLSSGRAANQQTASINKQGAVEFAHANVVEEYTSTSRRIIGDHWGRVGGEDEGQWRVPPLDQEET